MQTPRWYLVLAAFASASLSLAALSPSVAGDTQKSLDIQAAMRGYKKWTQVNPKPLLLPAALDVLCVVPTGHQLVQSSQNPHRKRYFVVYVNEMGRDAMRNQAKPVFPEGTVIVKEKRAKPNDPTPELMTVMVKREKGFAPSAGDWEYLALDGKGQEMPVEQAWTPEARAGRADAFARTASHPSTPIERAWVKQANPTCQSCHAMTAKTDYVFRTYLPEDIRKRLHVTAPDGWNEPLWHLPKS